MELSPPVASVQFASGSESDVSQSLINKICGAYSGGLHFAAPIVSLQTNEFELVRVCYKCYKGFPVLYFIGSKLNKVIVPKLVEIVLNKVERSRGSTPPTLRAFACSVSAWLRRLRDIALKEEVKIINSESGTAPTLLGLTSSLSRPDGRPQVHHSLHCYDAITIQIQETCQLPWTDFPGFCVVLITANKVWGLGAEYLLHIVQGAIPQVYFECDPPVPATNIAAHILNHLYKKFNEVCHVQGGEEDAYRMLLYIFIGSLLPYIEGIDSWIFEGTLDDPFEEMFFYANKAIAIDEAEFWEKSYLLRPTQVGNLDVAHATTPRTLAEKGTKARESTSASVPAKGKGRNERDLQACPLFMKDMAKEIISAGKSLQLIQYAPTASSAVFGNYQETAQGMSQLTLSEVFCLSLTALIGHGDHVSEFFWQDNGVVSVIEALGRKEKLDCIPDVTFSEKIWFKFLVDTLPLKAEFDVKSVQNHASVDMKREIVAVDIMGELPLVTSFCPENPAITVCHRLLHENCDAWDTLNLSKNFYLPPLNDEDLRMAVFGGISGPVMETKGTNYSFGSSFGASEYARSKDDTKMLEVLFPFPSLLPSFKEDLHVSELLPFQKNSTIVSRVLSWVQVNEPKATPLPVVILQECLIFYIKKQVDKIGRQILSKLLYDWRLMDELGVLRAIYLLGSGDLLQHFFTVIFNKLDKGESWDDDFELNTVLQESIRNSADGTLLSAPDSLVVSITNNHGSSGYEQHNTSFLASPPRKSRGQSSGIDGLNFLKFSYKVSWPLELIANNEALKKYNQVMIFLLKVKRAKFVLDKARRWMWKDRGTATVNRKRHWLLEQKLLHFVDAFHLYVMDRVYHSAWRELCEGMSAAGSLDEVIEVHDAYLLSIQRQCFVVPDKLWALIASRINSILGLALDFSSIQQTLSSGGGAVSAIKARCEMEVDRIEKQFDDCIAFLLRVLSFKLNVGHFPHLADLVTRINYNYFYMSDSGNLKTIPGSDIAASKLGKASVGTN